MRFASGVRGARWCGANGGDGLGPVGIGTYNKHMIVADYHVHMLNADYHVHMLNVSQKPAGVVLSSPARSSCTVD